MKIGATIGIYAAILAATFGVTVGIMYGVSPDDPYAETEQDHMIDSLFTTLEASELEGSVVVNSNGEDTVIDFAGTLGLDINNLALDSIYADLTLEVNFPYGSDLVAGIQFEDSVIYLEYNLGQDNEIDMYMDINCLDDISLVLTMLGLDLSLDSLLGDLDLDEIGEAIENMPYVKKKGDSPAHFELDLFGITFNLECDKKYNFLGGIWSTIETANGYVDVDLTMLPTEQELVSVPYSNSWVPLDLLVSALGGTLTYTYYEFTGSFDMSMEVDYGALLGTGSNMLTVNLGFENLTFKMDLSSGFTMALDYDVKITTIMYIITINGNSNSHYYDKGSGATKFNSTTLNSRHQTIYYDSSDPYIYVYSEDNLTLKDQAYPTTITVNDAKDVKYAKFSSSYFFNNIMDIIIYDLLGISETYGSMIDAVLGDTDLSAISFDLSNTFWENLIPSFTYNEAYTEETYEDGALVSSDDIPERYILDVDLGTMLGDDPLINDIILEIDLGDHTFLFQTYHGIDRIYVGANIFGTDISIDLTVDYTNCKLINTTFVSGVQEYIAAHQEDELNTWNYNPCYPESEPYSAA